MCRSFSGSRCRVRCPVSECGRNSLRPRRCPIAGAASMVTLLLLHDPDAIPLVGRRVRLVIAATVAKNLRGSILWSQFKRIGKARDSALPVPSSVAIETSLILIDDLRELREGLGRMMPEGLVDPARPRYAPGLD